MQVVLDRMSDALRCTPHFASLLKVCSASETYLVGGALRDVLSGLPVTDLDLIFPQDPTSIAKSFARLVGGDWFWLDQDRQQSRVVVNREKACPHYDFALYRAPTLEQDLFDRDFTMNAMALPLATTISADSLIDPFGGLDDFRHDSLRMVNTSSFVNDPLRIIKGVRHATALNLQIESGTLGCMRTEVIGLDRVAPERIRQEVWKILSDRHAARGLKLFVESGVGEQLFGAGFAENWRALKERLENCHNRWRRLTEAYPVVRDWLQQDIEQGLNVETLLLFSFLLSAVEKNLPVRLSQMWKLSRKAAAGIEMVAALDAAVMHDFTSIACNQRAYAWWSRRFPSEPKPLLMALAGHPQAGPITATVEQMIPLVAGLEDQRPNDLVDGHWLRNTLCLEEGPEMTRALELLRNAEIYGEVNNREDACRFLVGHYQNRIDNANFDTL